MLDFVLFVKHRGEQAGANADGDAAWERILRDPRPRPKLGPYLREASAEGEEPLDLGRMGLAYAPQFLASLLELDQDAQKAAREAYNAS